MINEITQLQILYTAEETLLIREILMQLEQDKCK
jgi:hypothetical protein